jgi:uncharacterized protein YdhG (YjbR/CyaY superfamily)
MASRAQRTRPTRKRADVDAYLSELSADERATLEKLRRDILAAVPGAEECISYGIPAVRLNGRVLVWFGAARNHCAFYPGGIVQRFQRELAKYDTSKGTIRFPPDRPLPSALVRKLVRARVADAAVRERSARRARAR